MDDVTDRDVKTDAANLPEEGISAQRVLETLVQSLRGLVPPLVELTEQIAAMVSEQAPSLASDADAMAESARQFVAMLDTPPAAPADVVEATRRYRHDLGNQLNHVSGYGQLLLLADPAQLPESVAERLTALRAACGKCEQALVQSKTRRTAAQSPSPPAELAEKAEPDSGSTTVERGVILVVDDDAGGRDVLTRMLCQQGHDAEGAVGGQDALDKIRDKDYDLVLLDILMPDIDGFQVLRRLKADPERKHIPVIIISALDEIQSVVRCIEMGAEDYLAKPYDNVLLKARINACLSKKRSREQELRQFFTTELSRQLASRPDLMTGRDSEVTILSCDIRGFSRISERLGTRSVAWVSESMGLLSECVFHHHGVLVDYIGDELLAMWGAPNEEPEHGRLACETALEMQRQLKSLDAKWGHTLGEPMRLGIGINTGVAHVGVIGSRRKFKYGPLGHTVNLTSRVQGATKYLGTSALLTGSTHAQLNDRFPVRRLCQIRVVNIHQPVEIFELMAEGDLRWHELKKEYELALRQFESRELRQAARTLGNLLAVFQEDGPSLALMARVVNALVDDSGPFDPVWKLPGK